MARRKTPADHEAAESATIPPEAVSDDETPEVEIEAPAATAEDRIRARATDPAALASGISITDDGVRLVFGPTASAPRRSFLIRGNEITAEE